MVFAPSARAVLCALTGSPCCLGTTLVLWLLLTIIRVKLVVFQLVTVVRSLGCLQTENKENSLQIPDIIHN